jgi:hypothetical protein
VVIGGCYGSSVKIIKVVTGLQILIQNLCYTSTYKQIKFWKPLGLTIGIHNDDNVGMFHSQALLYLIDRQPVRK